MLSLNLKTVKVTTFLWNRRAKTDITNQEKTEGLHRQVGRLVSLHRALQRRKQWMDTRHRSSIHSPASQRQTWRSQMMRRVSVSPDKPTMMIISGIRKGVDVQCSSLTLLLTRHRDRMVRLTTDKLQHREMVQQHKGVMLSWHLAQR